VVQVIEQFPHFLVVFAAFDGEGSLADGGNAEVIGEGLPDAVCMAFELAAYGIVSGLLYRLLPRKTINIYLTLIVSMILGRLVWGAAKWLLLGLAGKAFTLEMFLAGAVLNAVPGIILHIVLIPVLIMALEKAGVIDRH
jgi:hypothetical protein